MTEYNGVHGDFEWEIVDRTLKVFSREPGVGLLKVFENVNAINSEQATWSAQGNIDLNLDLLYELQRARQGARSASQNFVKSDDKIDR